MSKVLRLTDSNFEKEVLESDLPVLVDFWASWCPPCKMVEPTIAELADEYNGHLKIAKVNVDQNPRTTSKYYILGLPTFVLFSERQELERKVGAQSKAMLVNALKEALEI